jgi:hypothetical protein
MGGGGPLNKTNTTKPDIRIQRLVVDSTNRVQKRITDGSQQQQCSETHYEVWLLNNETLLYFTLLSAQEFVSNLVTKTQN